MGLSKWILKNGPGGVGWMTKSWIKQYNNYPSFLSTETKFEKLIIDFQNTQQSLNNISKKTDPDKLLIHSENCLATLMFCLMCETKGFEHNICLSSETYNNVLNVIYEIVMQLAPESTNFSFDRYTLKCRMYCMCI